MEILDNKCHLFTNLLKFKLSENEDSEFNYDEFCKINKENEKRRSMGSFFVHLMNNTVIHEKKMLLHYSLTRLRSHKQKLQLNLFLLQ